MIHERRVLCVCPSFPPIAYPDCLRLRLTLPYFQEFGWNPTVLCIDSRFVEGPKDPKLAEFLPSNLKIIHSYCIPANWSRKLGLGNLALRALPFLIQSVAQHFERKAFDLVFFSTTVFLSMVLGRYWLWRYQVPYILDFQDPWLSDYHRRSGSLHQSWKCQISQTLASLLEPFTLRRATHVISVSPGYVDTLLKRYSWLKPEQFTVLPFGAAETDFSILEQCPIKHSHFNSADGMQHWVYVGRGGSDMAFALRCLFQALKRSRQQEPKKFSNLLLHFIGTDYAPTTARKTVEPIAIECGVGDMVREHPQRIPYFEALQCLLDADALIVLGSDDPSYTASKIYPYILAQKPLLAIFHEMSSVVSVLRATKAGTVVTFKTGEEIDQVSEAISANWLRYLPFSTPETDWKAFIPYTGREMTRQQCAIFDRCLNLTKSVEKL